MAIKLGSPICELQKRPFVSNRHRWGISGYPFPMALAKRAPVTEESLSGLAIALFHALVYLAWNVLRASIDWPYLATGTNALRALASIGRASNDDVDYALRLLCTAEFDLPLHAEPDTTSPSTLLAGYDLSRPDGLVRWQFSDAVLAWCRDPGAVYSWMDLTVTRQLRRPADLRLYELGSAFASRSERTLEVWPRDLRSFLEVGDSYRDFSDFRGKLLAPTIKKLSECAPFKVTSELRPVGNTKHKVVVLAFKPNAGWKPESTLPARPLQYNDLTFLYDLPADDEVCQERAA